MASDSRSALVDPVLVAPLRGARVDAAAVTLSWEAAPGATSYLVQVATDVSFSNDALVAETELADTALDLDGEMDLGATYFWRVMACAGGAESSGERVESFIPVEDAAATDAAVMIDTPPSGAGNTQPADLTNPDAAEDLGPVAELFKAGGAAAAAEASGSAVGADTASEMGVEPEGVASAQILSITLAILVAIGVLVVILFNWKGIVSRETIAAASARVPGTSVSTIRYPVLYETEMQARRALDHYEVLNDAEGRYRIPIQEAMDAQVRAARTTGDSARADSPLPAFFGR